MAISARALSRVIVSAAVSAGRPPQFAQGARPGAPVGSSFTLLSTTPRAPPSRRYCRTKGSAVPFQPPAADERRSDTVHEQKPADDADGGESLPSAVGSLDPQERPGTRFFHPPNRSVTFFGREEEGAVFHFARHWERFCLVLHCSVLLPKFGVHLCCDAKNAEL